nr:hypothetical protein [Tanacetum cinerariifolium]
MSAKRMSWNEFSSSMALAVICLLIGRKFNFSKYIFDNLVRNVDSSTKFYMVGKGFSGVDTPLFEGMIMVQQVDDIADEGAASVAIDDVPVAVDEPSIPSPPPTTQPPPPSQDLPSTSHEDLFTYCIENGILQDASKPSIDNANVVNALQEPFVVKQDPGKGAHYGYNCPPNVLIILDPKPFNNQTIDKIPQTLLSFDPTCYSEDGYSFTYDSRSNLVDDFPNIFNPPLQPPTYSYEFCGNDAYYGHDCSLLFLFTYDPELCYNQDFNFSQNFQIF